MPYIPVPNTISAELVYTWDGVFAENVLHYVKASPWTTPEMEDAAAELVSKWNTHLKAQMPTNLSLVGIRLTDLSSETGFVYTTSAGLPIVGTNASPSLPNNCALVITKRTALRGRSYRGRIFHPGLVEAACTGSFVSGASVTIYLAAWANFLTLATLVEEPNMCVVSRYNNNLPRSTGVATLVTNLTSDGTVDSQRRRLPGRGA